MRRNHLTVRRMIPVLMIVATAGATLASTAGADRGATAQVHAKPAQNGRIVFQANVGQFTQLFTIEPDGTGIKRITHVPTGGDNFGAENPAWSPDGSTVAFDAAVPNGVNLFTVGATGGGVSQLPLAVGDFNGDPAYSPKGKRLSFDQDVGPSQPRVHGIFIANANGHHAHRVTTGIPTTEAFDTESQWAPDGTELAFTRVKNGRKAAIFTVDVDGSHLKQLTRYKLDAASPDWSPNGSMIAFNSYWDSPGGKAANIFTIPADGGHRTALTHNRLHGHAFSFRPSWSPNGKRIVFTHANRRGVNLYKMGPNGSKRVRVTHMPNRFPTNPDWGTAP